MLQEPISPSLLAQNPKIVTDFLETYSKRELPINTKVKGMKNIESYSRRGFIYAFSDGSSDETLMAEMA